MSVEHIVPQESACVFPQEGVYSANFAKELEGKYHTRIEKSVPKGHKLSTNPQYQEWDFYRWDVGQGDFRDSQTK